nr:hypothetical protein [Saliphagus sp. LR7]
MLANDPGTDMLELEATTAIDQPPDWASDQRRLFDLLETAVERFYGDYFGESGEPFWPPADHVGVDGFDDVLEGFYNWPLVYAMGGDERFLEYAREAREAAVERGAETETPFGHPMVVDGFEQCRDWFHLGESNQLTYNMGLAAPEDQGVVSRAKRFAGLYLGDGDVENYDADRRLVRAPQTGSMGPEYADLSAFGSQSTFGGYGSEYRWARHGLPWRDLEFESATELLDPDNEERLYEIYAERGSKEDIPLNLAITSLMINAYLHTGDDCYTGSGSRSTRRPGASARPKTAESSRTTSGARARSLTRTRTRTSSIRERPSRSSVGPTSPAPPGSSLPSWGRPNPIPPPASARRSSPMGRESGSRTRTEPSSSIGRPSDRREHNLFTRHPG